VAERSVDHLGEVKPRSLATVMALMVLTPVLVVVAIVAVYGFGAAIGWNDDPSAKPSLTTVWTIAIVAFLLLAFLANAWLVIVRGMITGRAGRLLSWWLAYILLGLLEICAVWGGVVTWRAGKHGDVATGDRDHHAEPFC
jgi:membrane protease YdiL (CAAX protease family)